MPRPANSVGLATVALLALLPIPASAQCPNGSPPPCTRAPAAVAAPSPDPARVVVLPFRITSADTLLGEGFAELLATEFTGEGTPRAVDMATVLGAWRRAGGGLRTPLPRQRSLAIARSLGAGLVVEGAIVGLGANMTVSAAALSVPNGTVRGTAARVSAPADSLESALRRTAAALIAATGGEARAVEQGAQFTSSPEALRQYLMGLALWRRGALHEAAAALDRAIARDSGFAGAVLRRYFAQSWGIPGGITDSMVHAVRHRLSRQERRIVDVMLGNEFPPAHSAVQTLVAADRAADAIADSPELAFVAGDWWFHFGDFVDPVGSLARAQELIDRALAVEEQATYRGHALLIALLDRDTARVRTLLPRYVGSIDPLHWSTAWVAATVLRDERTLARLRNSVDPAVMPSTLLMAAVIGVPRAVADEMYVLMRRGMATGANRTLLDAYRVGLALWQQRLADARALSATLPPSVQDELDEARLSLAIAGERIDADPDALAARFASDSNPERACLAAVWRRVAAPGARDPNVERWRSTTPKCAWALDLLAIAPDTGIATRAALARADSLLTELADPGLLGFEATLLARAWERSGDLPRALRASRYRTRNLAPAYAPWNRFEEGRLAELLGDTTAARRAYEAYVTLTAGADPGSERRRIALDALQRLR